MSVTKELKDAELEQVCGGNDQAGRTVSDGACGQSVTVDGKNSCYNNKGAAVCKNCKYGKGIYQGHIPVDASCVIG